MCVCVRVDGSMDRLIELLKEDNVNTQVEAAWCLNNIAGGTDDHAVTVLDAAGDSLVKLLSSGDVPLEVCRSSDVMLDVSLDGIKIWYLGGYLTT